VVIIPRKSKSLRGTIPGAKDRRFGRTPQIGFGSRTREATVTVNPARKREFPKLYERAIAAKKKRFVVPSDKFTYLPTTTPKRQLGVPTSMGDNIIVWMEFKPSGNEKKLIDQYFGNVIAGLGFRSRRRKTTSNLQHVQMDIKYVAKAFFVRLREQIRLKINEVVPEFTGELRKGMISSLSRSISSLIRMPYMFKLNTLNRFGNPIYYANPVNNMPTEWLAHPPNEPLMRMHHGVPKHLFDPDAETHWYEKVLDFARDLAQNTIGSIRRDIIRLYGISQLTDIVYNNLLINTKFK